ncbi:MAG: NAD-dependent deacetylase [Lachnospiraceae bacterium]|nr:NAD-dependent deacetylase [Lachnospiraceae bacterium]
MYIPETSKEEKINYLKGLIRDNSQMVCILGVGMEIECGGKNLWSNDEAYRIEDEYGHAPEEIYSSSFYATKKQKFYEFYKKEILDQDIHPGTAYAALKKLQDSGKLTAVITRDIDGLPEEAGLENVIRLHGSKNVNQCPKCHKYFDLAYMRKFKGIPLCEECQQPIRPKVMLYGEMVRNDIMTQAANAIRGANVVMLLGTNFGVPMVDSLLQYYEGNKVILITLHEHYNDGNADICIHGKLEDILPQIVI